jgi:Holliday junction resolvase
MGNNNYKRGYITERRCVLELKEAGYMAIRTAGSHSPWDVIAVRGDGVRLIQIKRSKVTGQSYSRIFREIKAIEVPESVTKELWIWTDHRNWQKHVIR